ncbi:MAG: hypothetical protein DI570_09260 [Phenylobacterium zucineum]|nr:MAG: hypothetical protein DI570_09260 [Phenylobacterium zucineum]
MTDPAPVIRNTERALNWERRTHFSWEEFDRLPKIIRDLMNYTPVNVGTGFVYGQIMGGGDIAAVARQAWHRWRRYSQQSLLKHYGSDHPGLRTTESPTSAHA